MLDMVEKMKRKKFVHWILALHTTKFHQAKVNSIYMGKLLIKINKSKHSFGKNPFICFSCFRKEHFLSRLFIRIFGSGGCGEGTNQVSQNNSFPNHSTPCKHSYHSVNTLTNLPFITEQIYHSLPNHGNWWQHSTMPS